MTDGYQITKKDIEATLRYLKTNEDENATGEKYESKPTLCDDCNSEAEVKLKIDKKKDITTWIYDCTGCSYKKVDVEDHAKWERKFAADEKRNKQFLRKYRKEFCFTEKEGSEAVLHSEQISSCRQVKIEHLLFNNNQSNNKSTMK